MTIKVESSPNLLPAQSTSVAAPGVANPETAGDATESLSALPGSPGNFDLAALSPDRMEGIFQSSPRPVSYFPSDLQLGPQAAVADPPDISNPAVNAFFEAHASAIAKWSAPDRYKLARVVTMLGDPANLEGAADANHLAARNLDNLGKLIDSGKILAQAASTRGDKITVLDTLAKSLERPLTVALRGRVDAKVALSDLVETLAHPDRIFQGEGTTTCTTAVVESLMATYNPGGFAAFAASLLFDGAAEVVGKDNRDSFLGEVKLSTGELDRDLAHSSGRSPLGAIIQGSLIEYASKLPPWAASFGAGVEATIDGGNPGSGSEFAGGRFDPPAGFGGGRFGAGPAYGGGRLDGSFAVYGGGESGTRLTADQLSYLLEVTIGVDVDAVSARQFLTEPSPTQEDFESAKHKVVDRVLETLMTHNGAYRNGIPVGVEVPVKDATGNITYQGHMVLVKGEETNGDILYQDPGDGKVKKMARAEFDQYVLSAVIPPPPPPPEELNASPRQG